DAHACFSSFAIYLFGLVEERYKNRNLFSYRIESIRRCDYGYSVVIPLTLLKNYPNVDNWRSVTEDQ
ncbi:MAG: hypothetical protein ACTSQ5_11210, partial [Promethearchaeota archaeon]